MARRLSIDRSASSITDRSRCCSKAGGQGTSWTLSLSSTMANRPQDLRHKLAIDAGDVLAFCRRAAPSRPTALRKPPPAGAAVALR
jgi:hypothetical protein